MFGKKKYKEPVYENSYVEDLIKNIQSKQMALCEKPETVETAIMHKFNYLYRDKQINEEGFCDRFEAEELKNLTTFDVYEILFTDRYKY